MQYIAVILVLSGAAFAQNIPDCASSAISQAVSDAGNPAAVCTSTQIINNLTAELQKVCSCADYNSALDLARDFCPSLAVTNENCNAQSTVSSSSTLSSLASSSASTSLALSTQVASSGATAVATPSSATNGTVVAPTSPTTPPTSTGAASSLHMGGTAMIGALLVALVM